MVAPFSPGVVLMGKRDFHPLSANFLLAKHLKSHWENYCKGKAEAGAEAKVTDWRVARTICVADDDKTAQRYGRDDDNSPYRFYWSQMWSKMKRGKRLYVFKSHKDQPDDEITLDYVLDHCMIHGSVNKVVDQVLKLREEIGDFGEIVYAGMDWVDPALAKRSMQLMAEQVDAARQRGDREKRGVATPRHGAVLGPTYASLPSRDIGGDMRYVAIVASFIGAVVFGLLIFVHPAFEVPFVVCAVLVAIGVWDIVQTKHSLRRNYPILANIRFGLEKIRPEIRQYFLESETDGAPFSRNKRSIVYQRAKGQLDKRPFGTCSRTNTASISNGSTILLAPVPAAELG